MIITSNNLNPFLHLAMEEHLLTSGDVPCPILLLWRSNNAVVIGKNQNPWLECNLQAMRESDTVLARRVSGGGAVYHDEGNLNVSLFVDRTEYDPQILFDLILNTLEDFGIHGQLADKNSLQVDGAKISGSAFALKPVRALHHATLLVSSDLDCLRIVLQPSPLKMETHAVRSKPASVVNLGELQPDLTMDGLTNALIDAFLKRYTEAGETIEPPEDRLDELITKYESWDWRYGTTPQFTVQIGQTVIAVKDGRISEPLPDGLPAGLLNSRLLRADLAIELSPDGGPLAPLLPQIP